MKKILIVFAACLLIAGCSVNGDEDETKRFKTEVDGIYQILTDTYTGCQYFKTASTQNSYTPLFNRDGTPYCINENE